MALQFIGLSQDQADGYRAGAADANGQIPEHHSVDEGNYPCRCCMRLMAKGEPMLILGHRPFSRPQPYAETGPIFLHGTACRSVVTDKIPPFLAAPRYLIRGYDAGERIVYGSGRIVETPAIMAEAEALFADESIRFIHVRSASNNCFHCRIERG